MNVSTKEWKYLLEQVIVIYRGDYIIVVIFATHWKQTQGTGVTKYFLNLVDELSKYDNLKLSILFREGVDSNNYKISGSKFTFPIKSLLLLRRIQPDVVYTDSNWYFLSTGLIWKKIHKSRLISTVHSSPNNLHYFGRKLMNYLMNSCDVITYVSKGLRRDVLSKWSLIIKTNEKITYAGVRKNEVSADEINVFNKKFNISSNNRILLMHSSPIAKVKADGTKILMNALKILLANHPELVLIITGSGPYLEELKQHAESFDLLEKVIFTGWLENPFVPLELCEIYTHISLGEGLPLSLLEAMIAGKPIVATAVGGIPEAITNGVNGILVEPIVDDIVKNIERLLVDKEYATKLGALARKTAEETFSWDKSADVFIKIFSNSN